jgi:hypothetical protein
MHYAVCTEETIDACNVILIGHLASSSALEKCHLENQVVDGRIILK